MINIKSCGISQYKFMDGEDVITTKNPTQEMYQSFITSKKIPKEKAFDWLTEVFDSILYEKDKHYSEELAFDIKVLIINDYFDYHVEQLEKRFPSSPVNER